MSGIVFKGFMNISFFIKPEDFYIKQIYKNKQNITLKIY
jgi:hypothetical protein